MLLNPVRSRSGVATVTVLTKPYPCPGRCVFCPTERGVPKSYLPQEPAVMRARRAGYNPYDQVAERLLALENTGHAPQKVELIIKGGTWSFYPQEYQRWFFQRCFEAANEWSKVNGQQSVVSEGTLEGAQKQNEAAIHRVVGLTIETRPDDVTQEEILRLRQWGVTRVELGVQILEDGVLEQSIRDHTTREIAQATALLRDSGFKVAYHLMPNLPGATPEMDLRSFRRLFEDSSFYPDALKIYPCAVLKSAPLYSLWRQGQYQPYDEETLLETLIQMKTQVPPTVRIERIARNIPSPQVIAGAAWPNLRQELQRRLSERGLHCRCIRCREVQDQVKGEFLWVRREYDASGGREIFLSFEDPSSDRLAALLRLRIPSNVFSGCRHWVSALEGCALVRELHTYGRQVPLTHPAAWLSLEEAAPLSPPAAQHRGFGRRLMHEAERIAREEFGLNRLAVIAGVGVREYYKKLGYQEDSTYMIKQLATRA